MSSAIGFVFLIWLCAGAACDAIYRKCFNWLVISGFGLALGTVVLAPETHPIGIELKESLIGGLLAFGTLLFFYMLGLMGAGDVKFAAVLGAWVGWKLLLPVWALSCAFALVHGLIARYDHKYIFMNFIHVNKEEMNIKRKFIPYVTYMSLATIIVLMLKIN
ncbi:A24 family peptidase [Comamonas aquatilis]|uniref:A24 family peptidase n=1 Tax=Comamonas aquatilis TaxID=1778406 RepID=UPI0039EEF0FD